MDEEKKALFAARTRYLEERCYLQQLKELVVVKARHALIEDNNRILDLSELAESPAAAAKLQQAGFDCSVRTVDSLARHLETVHIAQRLQLPSTSPKPLLPTADTSSQQDVESSDQLHGSKQHVLGITPLQLRKKHMPSKRAAQKSHAPILPTLERRLEQLAQESIAAVVGADAGPDAAAHVVSKIQKMQQQYANESEGCLEALAEYTHVAKKLIETRLENRQLLQTMVSKCILAEQPKLDKDHRDCLAALLYNLTGKLRVVQRTLWTHMYTKDSVAALRLIRQKLEAMEQQTRDDVEQASMRAEEYAQMSAEFQDVAAQYGKVQADLKESEGVIAHLRQLEREAQEIANAYV